MLSKKNGLIPIPSASPSNEARDKVIALALACMQENAEALLLQVRKQGGFGDLQPVKPFPTGC